MTRWSAPFAIARVAVLRLVRDRGNLFFVFVFPLLVVLLIGAQFGGQTGDLTLVVSSDDVGPLGEELAEDLDALDGVTVERVDTVEAVVEAVATGAASGGLLLPPGFDQAVRTPDRGVVLEFATRPDSAGPALQAQVVPVVGALTQRVTLADLVTVVRDLPFTEALTQADNALAVLPELGVAQRELGTNELADEFGGLGQFDLGAVQQLLLFVFVSSLVNAAALLQSREYGVTRRLLAHPTTTTGIIAGEALGRYGVAIVQGLYIIVGTLLLFRVNWGGPVSALVIMGVFAAVSSGAGLLLGALCRTQAQAAAAGIGIGLSVSAVGGSMLPLELFPDAMKTVSLVTPHRWAYEAYAETVRHDARLADVLPQLGVLLVMAVVVLAVAAWTLRRTLTATSA